jgi:peptide/nickel transport system permease protein
VVLTAATFAFLALQLAPGDPASALAAEGVPPEIRARLRAVYGFDQPLLTQYGRWLAALLRGDLGYSVMAKRPVADVLWTALPITALLAIPAFVLSAVIGMFVGGWQAAWAGRRRDRATSFALLVLYSVPEFWLALAFVLLFARWGHWLPPNGVTDVMHAYLSPTEQWIDRLRHLTLPVAALTVVGVATFARYQRAAMHQTLAEPFVQTARAGGCPRRRVLVAAWRASLAPVITLGGLLLPAFLAGVVFIEQVFAWPGVGTLLVQATSARDYPLVAGAVIVGSACTAICAALADVAREALDPRVGMATADGAERHA